MEVIKGTDFGFCKPTAVTIGKFDGLHRGHHRLILHTEHYKMKGYSPVVFTFDTNPACFFDVEQKLIYTNDEKEEMFSKYSLDTLIEYPFTKETSSMDPEAFFKELLIDKLNAKVIIVGEDFRFGYKRKGNIEALEAFGDKYNVKIDVVSKACVGEKEVSSSYIRDEIKKGNMDIANTMLGKPYSIYGTVIKGNQLGRTLDMPTANIEVKEDKLLPPNGVYTSRVIYNGRCYDAVTNIGTKPTIKGSSVMGVETHIFDFEEEIYGDSVIVEILHFQRPEMKFDSVDSLKEQMHIDKENAKNNGKRYKRA